MHTASWPEKTKEQTDSVCSDGKVQRCSAIRQEITDEIAATRRPTFVARRKEREKEKQQTTKPLGAAIILHRFPSPASDGREPEYGDIFCKKLTNCAASHTRIEHRRENAKENNPIKSAAFAGTNTNCAEIECFL